MFLNDPEPSSLDDLLRSHAVSQERKCVTKKGVRVREGENSLQLCLVISIWDFFDSFFKNLSIGDFIETKYLPKVAKLKWQNQDSNSGPCNYKANDLSLHQRE